MPTPRRTTAEAFYDVFADFPLEDQAAALRILQELHRQKQRDAKRTKPAPALIPLVAGSAREAADPARNAALLLPGQDDTERMQ